ncbi:RidA family protein [Sinorhizobium meliloti]|uniref:RidA family protein n=1 Tax=Rhizobium meliloti TaxID=382 RepID=UPI003F5CBD93
MFEVIDTGADPSDVPVSEAVRAGDLFWSVHISEDPVTGEPVFGDIETQARRTLQNLEIAIKAAGGSVANVVQMQVFLTTEPTLPA